MALRPVLGELELEKVQSIVVDGDQVLVEHGVPALEGDFLQRLGRRASKINLRGFLAGSGVLDSLKQLRDKLRAAEPVSFVADIATATRVDQVLIEEISVRELAGQPERFEYAFLLREFIPPPPTERERPPNLVVPPPPSVEAGILIVDVNVEGQPNFDFSKVSVTVEGSEESGAILSRTLTNRTENRWTENEFPPGKYTVEALVIEPGTLSGSVSAMVRAGQTTQVSIALRTGAIIARTFTVHFRFDKAFVEPCMRDVLKQVASYAKANTDEKLLIVGHTDKAGSRSYNQSLSERRARSVFAYLTFGIDAAARDYALAEWDKLRRRRTPGQTTSIKDTWDVREYQHMLQDLAFYPGAVDGDYGPLTNDAVRAYRCAKGLPPGTTVDDDVWDALIQDYLAEDELAVPASRLFSNCPNEQLKWLGCGEEDPLDRRETAFRPSRRVELLFVQADSLPCEVPQPDTFDLPPPGGVVNSAWCLGPGSLNAHCCFVSPHLIPGTNNPQPCPDTPQGPWCRQPVEPGTIPVNGLIQRELPDGSLEPVPGQAFVLTSPKGEFKANEQTNGEPVPSRTQGGTGPDRGTFTFTDLAKGFYTLEVRAPASAPVLVRLLEDGDSEVKGNAICKALHSDQDRLDVVIIDAPVQREIQLPVVVHLMTALHPTTRAIRTCPDPLDPARRVPQATARTEAEVQAFFDAANRIWRQARIRFELDPANIIHETYSYRTECQVDRSEFETLLERCAYPDVVNVFFIADLAGMTEAGFGVSPEGGAALGVAGCAVGDRFQTTVLGPPTNVSLSAEQTEQVLAHELGHFLNLDHVDDVPANIDRLMRPGTLSGTNRMLTLDEVNSARTSQGATDDCVSLSLSVTGATQIGGTLSHQYIYVQPPELIDPFDITVDAENPDHLLANGTVTMTGGNPGENNLQRTVSKSTTGEYEIEATYTSTYGTQPVNARVVILVVSFELSVNGASRVSPGSSTFITLRRPTQVVTVRAIIDPRPFCVPDDLIIWSGGVEVADPLQVEVSRADIQAVNIRATVAGVERSITITVIEVRIPEISLIGLNQTNDIPITVNPAALPSEVSIKLQLRRTPGTGEAQFISASSTVMTITQSSVVNIRGITASSVSDNIHMTAKIAGQTEIAAQEEFTVVDVTIGSVTGIRPSQTLAIPITVTPALPPVGGTLTVELSTIRGTGSTKFVASNSTIMVINKTTAVIIEGGTPSSTADNIRLSVRIASETQILAEETFTVLNAINIFLHFEVWNLNTLRFESLPAGISVDLIDENTISDDTLATQRTNDQGRILFNLASFGVSGEDEPDLFFRVRPKGVFHAGLILPDEWSTKGWRATDGSPGIFEDFSGTELGAEVLPLTYRIGVDVHARLNYLVDNGGRIGNIDPAPEGVGVSFYVTGFTSETRKRTFITDANGEVHGVIFDVDGGDSVILRVDFDIRDPSINLKLASVDIPNWDTEFDDNEQTSIGSQISPRLLHANSDERNVSLYFLKCLREISTFLFHITGGIWTGFDELRFFRSSLFGVAFSWPVGEVKLPPNSHWDRDTIIHEITHQTMWKEHNRSSSDIAFEALFGDLALTHFINLLSNSEHALIEGWAEFLAAIFERSTTPAYIFTDVGDDINSSGLVNPQPLAPPPNNRGESVEGAYANGMWAIFETHIVTSAVSVNAHVPETNNGDVTVTASWITNLAVRQRFLSMIWEPFLDLRNASSDPTTTQHLQSIRLRNLSEWHLLQAELQSFNMAMDVPTIISVSPNAGPISGGQIIIVTGTKFVTDMDVAIDQVPLGRRLLTNVVVSSSSTLTAVSVLGVLGIASIIVTTKAGTDTLANSYTYI